MKTVEANMKEILIGLCVLAVASASSSYRTRGQQTLSPFNYQHNAYPSLLPMPHQLKSAELQNPSSTSLHTASTQELPSPYSNVRPLASSMPLRYLPSTHEIEHAPPSHWPHPVQVFYASQYYPQHPHPLPIMHSLPHHEESNHSPSYSTASPLLPHLATYPQPHNTVPYYHQDSSPDVKPQTQGPHQDHMYYYHVKPQTFDPHQDHMSYYHVKPQPQTPHKDHMSYYQVKPQPQAPHQDHMSYYHVKPQTFDPHQDHMSYYDVKPKPQAPHHDLMYYYHVDSSPNDEPQHHDPDHGPSHPTPHNPHNSDNHVEPPHSTPKPPPFSTEHLLQFLQNSLHFRDANPYRGNQPLPTNPYQPLPWQPLDADSGVGSVPASLDSGDKAVQSQQPTTRRHWKESHVSAPVLWETSYRPLKWDHLKWAPKWDLKHYKHFWSGKWPGFWWPGKKEDVAAPHHDPHSVLEPWDHGMVPHKPPVAHYASHPSHHHPLDAYLQHDEPWSNTPYFHANNNNPMQQSYHHAQFYHHEPATPGYNMFPLLGHRQYRYRPPGGPVQGRVQTSSELLPRTDVVEDSQGRVLEVEPTSSQVAVDYNAQTTNMDDVTEDQYEAEESNPPTDDIIDYQPEDQLTSYEFNPPTDGVIDYQPEDRFTSYEAEESNPLEQHTQSADVNDSGLPSWLPAVHP